MANSTALGSRWCSTSLWKYMVEGSCSPQGSQEAGSRGRGHKEDILPGHTSNVPPPATHHLPTNSMLIRLHLSQSNHFNLEHSCINTGTSGFWLDLYSHFLLIMFLAFMSQMHPVTLPTFFIGFICLYIGTLIFSTCRILLHIKTSLNSSFLV